MNVSKPVLYLIFGSFSALIIPLLFAPLLSRLYSVESFSELGLVIAYTAIIVPFLSFRLDSILLNHSSNINYDFKNILFVSTLVFTLVLLVFVFLLYCEIISILWVFALLSAFSSNVLSAYINKLTASGNLKSIALVKAFRPFSEVFFSIFFFFTFSSFSSTDPVYVYLGLAFSYTLSFVLISIFIFKKYRKLFLDFNVSSLYVFLGKNFQYITYELPTSLLVALSNSALVLCTSIMYSPEIVGYVSFAVRYMNAPLGIISNVITILLRKSLISEFKLHKKGENTFKQFAMLLVLLSGLFYAVMIKGAEIFIFAFGGQWETAGEIAEVISLLYAIKITSTPLSSILYVTGKNRLRFLLQLLIFALSLTAFIYSYIVEVDYINFLLIYAYLLSSGYIAYIFLCYKVSVIKVGDV